MVISDFAANVIVEPIDTFSLDTMLEGFARHGLEYTMGIMRRDTETMMSSMLWAYDHYNCDCMFVTQHVGCQSACGSRGMIKKVCRERDIPVLFLEFDYNDDRVLSPERMRMQIGDFFETFMA